MGRAVVIRRVACIINGTAFQNMVFDIVDPVGVVLVGYRVIKASALSVSVSSIVTANISHAIFYIFEIHAEGFRNLC